MRGQELYEIFARNAMAHGARPCAGQDIVRHQNREMARVQWYQLSNELKCAYDATAKQLTEIGGQRMLQFDSKRVLMEIDANRPEAKSVSVPLEPFKDFSR